MIARRWLGENGYTEALVKVDLAISRITAKGKKSRRDWWQTLAGGVDGKPSVREGIEFPVLRAAQIRQGKPITANAICLNEDEEIPAVVSTKRWRRRRLPSKARNIETRTTAKKKTRAS
jgi:hypothetical protein